MPASQVIEGRSLVLRRLGPAVLAIVLAAIVLTPLAAIVALAIFPSDNIWPHLWATTLPRYLANTAILAAAVGILTSAVGAGAAWLTTIYDFPGRRWLEWALFLPLGIPAYVGAYALVDFLEFAGPLQTALRAAFGWRSATDYAFPEVRSRGFAVVVLTSALYPYVYLLTRAALREQSGAVFETARALGAGGIRLFWRLGLPLSRPAIAAGAAIAMMETVADFGVVDFFAVQTLTTGIFTTWLQAGNPGGAAQIALLSLGLILAFVTLEKLGRKRLRFHQTGRQQRRLTRIPISGPQGLVATGLCLLPVLAGFVLPVMVMSGHALAAPSGWFDPRLLAALARTVGVSLAVALTTTVAAVLMVYAARLTGRTLPRVLMPVTAMGYAMPGAVLGLGVIIPLAALDTWQADTILALTGWDPGLILTGTAFAIIFAATVRFFAIAQGAADTAMGRIPPSLPMAARSLGRSAGQTLCAVHLPMMRASVGTALLLIFVDTAKELPMTLMLRPFGFDTLAIRVYEQASLENIQGAAPPALVISTLGILAVALLARSNR